jgi:hypothetical protein
MRSRSLTRDAHWWRKCEKWLLTLSLLRTRCYFQATWQNRIIGRERRAGAERLGIGDWIESVINRLIDQERGRRTPTPPHVYGNEMFQDHGTPSPFPFYDNAINWDQPTETSQITSNSPPVFLEINQRAGRSAKYHHVLFARLSQIDSSDNNDDPSPRPVSPPQSIW